MADRPGVRDAKQGRKTDKRAADFCEDYSGAAIAPKSPLHSVRSIKYFESGVVDHLFSLSEMLRKAAQQGDKVVYQWICEAVAQSLDRVAQSGHTYTETNVTTSPPGDADLIELALRRDLQLPFRSEARVLVELLRHAGRKITAGTLCKTLKYQPGTLKVSMVRLRKSLEKFELGDAVITVRRCHGGRDGGYIFSESGVPALQKHVSFELAGMAAHGREPAGTTFHGAFPDD